MVCWSKLDSAPTALSDFDADTDHGDLGVWERSGTVEFEGTGSDPRLTAYIGVPNGPTYEFKSGVLFLTATASSTIIDDIQIYEIEDFSDTDGADLIVDITEV